ncbi:hypothetical protein ACRYCC_37325 [Actinomadura scrupuli]|uniref:hypothetical protein n=1 Tax=Actinomadura scrupuli TaxID=559629 RepID=UPI003D996ECA
MIETDPPVAALDADVEYRLRLIRDDAAHDDLAVALGLLAAGFSTLPPSAGPELDRATVDGVLGRAGDRRSVMYDLWYRMKIPFGEAELDSWYVLALAVGRTRGDLAAALELHSEVLQRLAADRNPKAVFADEFGLTGPVQEGGEQEFAAAVLAGQPFWCGRPRPWRADLRQRALDGWTAMREEELPVLLLELKQRIEGLEQIRFFVRGELLDNRQVGAVLLSCVRTRPGEWADGPLAVATLAWMWREAGFCLQELNQSIISMPMVFDFVVRRLRDYEGLLAAAPAALPAAPADLARLLGRLRAGIERDHLRCLQFDGGNWERREFLVPRSACERLRPLPADLRRRLEEAFGTALAGDGPQVWADAVDNAVAAGRTPTDVIKTLAHWAAADTTLPVDYAICTVPMGVKLDAPWTLEYEDVFCYTAFSEAFDRDAEGVPFDFVGISNAIGQRLRYNAVKKAQNYTLLRRFKAQSFNLPDIAVAEDANHGGHRAAGIRLSCRIPTYIRYEGIVWKGLADIRLNRTFYREHREFRPSDIPAASRLAEWLGWIADATYARGLKFDPAYGKKLTRTEES